MSRQDSITWWANLSGRSNAQTRLDTYKISLPCSSALVFYLPCGPNNLKKNLKVVWIKVFFETGCFGAILPVWCCYVVASNQFLQILGRGYTRCFPEELLSTLWQQRQEQGRYQKKTAFKRERPAKKKSPPRAFKRELLENFNINIDEDSSEIHLEKVCHPCKRLLYRVRESAKVAPVSVSRTIEKWTSHVELRRCLTFADCRLQTFQLNITFQFPFPKANRK